VERDGRPAVKKNVEWDERFSEVEEKEKYLEITARLLE